MDVQQVVDRIQFYEMDDTINAFIERMTLLKELAEKDLPIAQIDTEMRQCKG